MANEDERPEGQPEDPAGGNDPDTRTGAGDDPAAEVDRLRAELRKARHWEERAKANADAAERLKEIEDSKKTELEKLTEQQAAAERRAAEAEQRAMRLEVAAAKGLTPAQAKRLVGTTVDELEADAEELLASFRTEEEERGDPDLPRRPRERLRSGSKPAVEPEETDPRKLAANVAVSRF